MIRVLVADDQRINRVLLAGGLDPKRYQVIEAENGRDALDKFDAHRPDVVLLDVMMPEMDGFEATRAIKHRIGHDHVPVILVTSLTDEKSLSQGMEAGADDFVPKPFNRVVLESKMKAALRIRNLFQSLNRNREELKVLYDQGHREQVMAAKLMDGVLRTEALHGPMFKYRTRPMDIFNGDLLMAAETSRGKCRVVLGDFAGHGLAAAIGGLPVAMDFERICHSGVDLLKFAREANVALREVLPRDRFLAAAILDIDTSAGTIEIINAGMPPILVRGRGGGIRQKIGSTHFPLAILDDFPADQPIVKLELEDGDRLYLYSDGVTEALNSAGDVFGDDRFERLLGDIPDDDDVFQKSLEELDAFVNGAAAEDDVTLLEVFPDALAMGREISPSVTMVRIAAPIAHFRLDLCPPLLRNADISHMLESMLQSFEALEGHRASIFAILVELLNNAIDHGLLGLDSRLKHDLDGFVHFYEERSRRLDELDVGLVSLDFNLYNEGVSWKLDLEVRDTGPGFDISKRRDGLQQDAHGRGILMVEGLCESVKYFEPGNRVRAIYCWKKELNRPKRGEA